MENLQSYIESGILELYVLGDLNSTERAEVEAMCKLHPEVKVELDEIELMMNNIADDLTLEPSERVREGFFNSITFSDEEAKIAAAPKEEAKVVTINSKQLNFYKFSLAACLALLLVSIIAVINLNKNLNDSKAQIASLQSSNQSFANQVNYLDNKVSNSDKILNMYSNPAYKMVSLKGTANSPESNIVVAFNPKEEKVMLDLHSMKMPKNDAEHQYQLWALVDGKPVDLGVFDAESNEIGLKGMKSIGKAQTFAVTLEPRGGSVNPTLEKLMVIGNII
ncbi:MAG: anti-sigma factor [Bacteroidetes bacterium]|nr:anti-sigma factor [Bacteroidota bacterium]MBU1372936.1 anti-sigma factor [Bacteroidota bacterium]MBU1484200.1 anti-sigma factor [Bacteroidota bacterium]MBU1761537.1 anti-sigma factor [Bacteroidota bacterium]MBU2267381.1 anti-sigma factor [Bacteroidota bacterium]